MGIKRAVAWRTITEIVRHHPGLDLRVMEDHPCGGLYDCLVLVHGPTRSLFCSFNLAGSSLALGKPIGPVREFPCGLADHGDETLWRYPQHGLGSDRGELARAVEAALGLPERSSTDPPSTKTGLALGVVAELLDRVALGRRPVDVRSGWGASTFGCAVRPWAADKPGVAGVPESAQSSAASRYWSLDRAEYASEPAVVVDLASTQVWIRGEGSLRLANRYAAGRGVRALAWTLEQALDGAPGP